MTYLNDYHNKDEQVIVMGDINIGPIDADIGIGEPNAETLVENGQISFQPEEREWLKTLMDWGFVDSFRFAAP